MNCELKYLSEKEYNANTKLIAFQMVGKNGNFVNQGIVYYICLPDRAIEVKKEYKEFVKSSVKYEFRSTDNKVLIYLTHLLYANDIETELYSALSALNLKITLEDFRENLKDKQKVIKLSKFLANTLDKLENGFQTNILEEKKIDFDKYKNKKFGLQQAIIRLSEWLEKKEEKEGE